MERNARFLSSSLFPSVPMAKSEYGSKCCPLFLACALCRVGEPRGRDILIEHDRAVDTLDLVATSSSIARYSSRMHD